MKTKTFFKALGILSFIFLFTIYYSCKKEEDSVPEQGQTIGIENIVSVTIPDGVIYTKSPSVKLIRDSKLHSLLDEFKSFLYLTDINHYQIRLDVGRERPLSENILVKFNIPDSLSVHLKDGKKATIVALLYQNGGEEILDNFEPITSSYNDNSKTIEAKLPLEAFTNARTGNYEAILSIALFNPNKYSKSPQKLNAKSNNECDFEAILPVPNDYITSPFGYRCHPVSSGSTGCDWKGHKGTDYRALEGSPVVAVMDGVVNRVKINNGGTSTGYGLYIIIDHGANGQTLYAHLKENSQKVSEGDIVKKGQIIALSGNTGTSSGPHLHFEYSQTPNIISSNRRNVADCLKRDYSVFPKLEIFAATDIKSTSATLNGAITISENITVFTCGFWYDIQPNPQGSGKYIEFTGAGSGPFNTNVTNLTPNKNYYVRTYAYYNNIPFYSDVINFKTEQIQFTKVSTVVCNESDITETTAIVFGDIVSAGEPAYTEKGICWSTHTNSTISDNKKSANWNSGSLGLFSSNLTGLDINTTYYAKSYVMQNDSIIYGNEITFKTLEPKWQMEITLNFNGSIENYTTDLFLDGYPASGGTARLPNFTHQTMSWSNSSYNGFRLGVGYFDPAAENWNNNETNRCVTFYGTLPFTVGEQTSGTIQFSQDCFYGDCACGTASWSGTFSITKIR